MSQEWRASADCDRARLELLGPRRAQILELAEIQEYGRRMFGDPDYIHLYGMRPAVFYQRGVRLSGRTAAECLVDPYAEELAAGLRDVLQGRFPGASAPAVVDFFTGSGNMLFHAARASEACLLLGSELDEAVFRLTRTNFHLLGQEVLLVRAGYETVDWDGVLPRDRPCLLVVSPPWGGGYSIERGLDLRRSEPPIRRILSFALERCPGRRWLFAIQTSQNTDPASVDDLTRSFPLLARGRRYLICGAPEPGRNP